MSSKTKKPASKDGGHEAMKAKEGQFIKTYAQQKRSNHTYFGNKNNKRP